jgi:hypothetical protein
MSRRTENWPLAGHGTRQVPGWDDGPTPPTRPDWPSALLAVLVVLSWIAVALRAWGWL